jgi:hypothetical protein
MSPKWRLLTTGEHGVVHVSEALPSSTWDLDNVCGRWRRGDAVPSKSGPLTIAMLQDQMGSAFW